jgi:hypothetical protein
MTNFIQQTPFCEANRSTVSREIFVFYGIRNRLGEARGVYRILVGKPDGERPMGRPRRRWEDNILMDFQEVGCWIMGWIEPVQDRDRCGGHL